MLKIITLVAMTVSMTTFAEDIGVVDSDGSVYQSYTRSGVVYIKKCSRFAILQQGEVCEDGEEKSLGYRNEFAQSAFLNIVNNDYPVSSDVARLRRSIRLLKDFDTEEYESLKAQRNEREKFSSHYNTANTLETEAYQDIISRLRELEAIKAQNDVAMVAAERLKSKISNLYSQINNNDLNLEVDGLGVPADLIKSLFANPNSLENSFHVSDIDIEFMASIYAKNCIDRLAGDNGRNSFIKSSGQGRADVVIMRGDKPLIVHVKSGRSAYEHDADFVEQMRNELLAGNNCTEPMTEFSVNAELFPESFFSGDVDAQPIQPAYGAAAN